MVTILLVLFIFFALINILYYIGYFSFASATPEIHKKITNFPVSVIVCAKNEAENLKRFVPGILKQQYPDFEVILVNDASADDTLEVMEEFLTDPRVKIVNVQNNEAFWGKKKYALTLGIKKARNPYLLFTDADCKPESDLWITKMVDHFSAEKSIVLGYGGYMKKKGSLLNKLIRFETLFTAIQYFSYARWGIPYMGVGRNLAYTAKEFYDQNGFATHLHIRSGDDDLFVNQAGTSENTAICFEQEAITRSVPKSSFGSWFQQKRRHITTAGFYKRRHRTLLGTFFFSQFATWLLFLFFLILQVHWELALIVFGIRLIIQYVVVYKSAKKLDERDLVWLLPFLELILICSQFAIFIRNLISKPRIWK